MFNFIKAKIQRWGSNEAREALQYFVDMLKGADLGGRALTVALATDFRNKVIETDEYLDARSKGLAPTMLLQMYRDLQKAEMFPNAAGVAVWVHTERAINDLTVVPVAKEMWALLAEAFPYVEEAANGYMQIGGHSLDLRDYNMIPEGFEL